MSSIDFSGFSFADDYNISKGMFSKINLEQIIEKANKSSTAKLQNLEVEQTKKKGTIQSLIEFQNHLTDIKLFLNSSDGIQALRGKKVNIRNLKEGVIEVDVTNYAGQETEFIIGDSRVGMCASIMLKEFDDVKDSFNVDDCKIKIELIAGNDTFYGYEFEIKSTDSFSDFVDKVNQSGKFKASIMKVLSDKGDYGIIIKCIYNRDGSISVSKDSTKISPLSYNSGTAAYLEFNNFRIYPIYYHKPIFQPFPGLEITLLSNITLPVNTHATLEIGEDRPLVTALLNKFTTLYNNLQDFIASHKTIKLDANAEKPFLYESEGFRVFTTSLEALFSSSYEFGFVTKSDGHIEVKHDIFFSDFSKNKDRLDDFFKAMIDKIDTFISYNGIIKGEIETHTKAIEKTLQQNEILNAKIKNKKKELVQKFSSLEGKIVQSEQLIKMMELYTKQLGK